MRLLLALFIILLSSSISMGVRASVLMLESEVERVISARPHVYVLPFQDDKLTLDDILELHYTDFRETNADLLDQLLLPGVVWMRLILENTTEQHIAGLIELCLCFREISIYEVADGHLSSFSKSGSSINPNQKNPPSARNLTRYSLEPGQQKTYYFKVYSDVIPNNRLITNVGLWNDWAYFREFRIIHATHFLYAGIMLMFALFGLLVYFMFRDRIFIAFSVLAVAFVYYFLSASYTMVLPSYVGFGNHQLRYISEISSISFMIAVSFWFLSEYIKMKKHFPRYYYFLLSFSILLAIWYLAVALPPFYPNLKPETANYFSLLWLLSLLYPIVSLARKGHNQSKVLLVATAILVITFIIYTLTLTKFFPRSPLAHTIVQMGTILFFMLLFYNIFIKITKIKSERERARTLSELKSRFFTNISHEFRTPLTLIMGPVGQLAEKEESESKKKLLQTALKHSQKLLAMVNGLLELSRLDASKVELNVSRFDFNTYLKGLVMSFETLAELRKIDLQFKGPDSKLLLWFDLDKMEVIISNLLSNAFKFTPANGRISVEVIERDDVIEVLLSDTGVGISDDSLPHIFDRFFQAEKENPISTEGTGIGLSLVKDYVDLHSGKISVKSEIGRGTTFSLIFKKGKNHFEPGDIISEELSPVIDGEVFKEKSWARKLAFEEQVTSPLSNSSTVSTPKRTTILLVEDNTDVREFIKKHFIEDYEVLEAEDGERGMKLAREHQPHLIVSDVMMPRMDGFEFCNQLKSDIETSHIPVILLTAKSGQEAKLQGLEFGADDYITKPFHSRELIIRVKKLIELRASLQQKILEDPVVAYQGFNNRSPDRSFLESLTIHISDNIDNSQFGVSDLAKGVAMSQTQLNRKLKSMTNLTANKYIQHVRLKKALLLVREAKYNVSEIAALTGFNSPAYFVKLFREEFGKTPGALMKAEGD